MTSLTEFLNSKTILEWMWAHGKFLTDSQAQAIINKIDQKQDGKVKHILFQFYFSQGLQLERFNSRG